MVRIGVLFSGRSGSFVCPWLSKIETDTQATPYARGVVERDAMKAFSNGQFKILNDSI